MTTHPLNARAVPRPVAQRLTPDDVACAERAQAAYLSATDRDGILAGLREVMTPQAYALFKHGRSLVVCQRYSPALARVLADIVALANAQGTEAECMFAEQACADIRAACFAGTARESLDVLDAQDVEADNAEYAAESARKRALCLNDTTALPALELAEATVREEKAAINTAYARTLRADAHRRLTACSASVASTAHVGVHPRAATLSAMGGSR